jgi:hypothetical protein
MEADWQLNWSTSLLLILQSFYRLENVASNDTMTDDWWIGKCFKWVVLVKRSCIPNIFHKKIESEQPVFQPRFEPLIFRIQVASTPTCSLKKKM